MSDRSNPGDYTDPYEFGDPPRLLPMPGDDAAAITGGNCPDCRYRGFVLGPMGGASQNIECGNVACRARFNVTVYAGQVLLAQRIERQAEGGAPWPSEPRRAA